MGDIQRVTGKELLSVYRAKEFNRLLYRAASYVMKNGREVAFEASRNLNTGECCFSSLAYGTTDQVKTLGLKGSASGLLSDTIPDAIRLTRVHFHPDADPLPIPSEIDLLGLHHGPVLNYEIDDLRPVFGTANVLPDGSVAMLLLQKRHMNLPLDIYVKKHDVLDICHLPASSLSDYVEGIRKNPWVEALDLYFHPTTRSGYRISLREPELDRFSYVPRLTRTEDEFITT